VKRLTLALALVSGCGATSAQVQARYAAEVAQCAFNERAIVSRPTTPEEDARDLAIERARCDARLREIVGVQ
jgi:hypothetical protein